MPSSHTDLLTHLVFSTKHRENTISPDLQPRLFAYIGGIASNSKCSLLAAGGMPDHIHLFIRRHPTIAEAEIIRLIKSNSSDWIHDTFPTLSSFRVANRLRRLLRQPLARSRSRTLHQHTTRAPQRFDFKAEFLRILEQHNLDYDERYIWD